MNLQQQQTFPVPLFLYKTAYQSWAEPTYKETLNKSFLPFFTTLSVTYFRALLKTAKRMLRIIQLFPNTKKPLNYGNLSPQNPHISKLLRRFLLHNSNGFYYKTCGYYKHILRCDVHGRSPIFIQHFYFRQLYIQRNQSPHNACALPCQHR